MSQKKPTTTTIHCIIQTIKQQQQSGFSADLVLVKAILFHTKMSPFFLTPSVLYLTITKSSELSSATAHTYILSNIGANR